MGDMTKNFSRKEFACKHLCGQDHIDEGLVTLLQEVRDNYGKSMRITSGVRCPDHNKAIGGVKGSAHERGLAVDIECLSSRDRYALLPLLWSRFDRIGIGATFIHVDIDESKPQDVLWEYSKHAHMA